jgi:hypothetical protein
LELKAETGRASEAHKQFLADMERAGASTCMARGLDAAIKQLERWKLFARDDRRVGYRLRCTFFFLRQLSRPNPTGPVAKSGSAEGSAD